MNPAVDNFLIDGCGRCEFYKTPDCKVHPWNEQLIELRRIALDSGLKEDFKWSQPCYTLNDQNVFIISALKDYACIGFFKGSLMQDEHNMLTAPGERSQAARQLRFTDTQFIIDNESEIKSYIQQAIEIEKSGKKVEFSKEREPLPEELEAVFAADIEYRGAFESLTLGRQRGYIIHFSQPRQSKTRFARIEKYRDQIIQGIGMHDKYKSIK